jgi:periplasmic protein TonB
MVEFTGCLSLRKRSYLNDLKNGVSMKSFNLILLVIAAASTVAFAKNRTIYADVLITDVEPTKDFIWQRKDKNAPKYPIEFAKSEIRGCAILSFKIDTSGETEDVEVITSIPNKYVGKFSRQMLKKWKWEPASVISKPVFEKRVIRLDFCMGSETAEQSHAFCLRQSQLSCG